MRDMDASNTANGRDRQNGPDRPDRPGLLRLLLVIALALAGIAGFWMFGDRLGFHTLAERRGDLIAWRDANYAMAVAVFIGVYIASVVFSIPGAIWISITGGFLFGTVLGTVYNVTAATTGATLLFLIARSSLGAWLRSKAEGWVARVAEGFERDQVSFLLAMRLAPGMPFFVANLIPAFFRVGVVTYVWTTFAGIIPAAIVYTSLGAGIGEVIDRGEMPDLSIFADPMVYGPLLGLMAISLVPVVLKRLRRAGAGGAG